MSISSSLSTTGVPCSISSFSVDFSDIFNFFFFFFLSDLGVPGLTFCRSFFSFCLFFFSFCCSFPCFLFVFSSFVLSSFFSFSEI